jgi:hypothetical protein
MKIEFAKEITSRFLYVKPQIDGIENWPTESGDPVETDDFAINTIGDDNIFITVSGGWQENHTLELKMVKGKLHVIRDFGENKDKKGNNIVDSLSQEQLEIITKALENFVAEGIPSYSLPKIDFKGGSIITETITGSDEECEDDLDTEEEIEKIATPGRDHTEPLELEKFKYLALENNSVTISSGGRSSPALAILLKELKGDIVVASIGNAEKVITKAKSPEISDSLGRGIDLYGRGLESKFKKAITPYLEKIKNWKNINGWPQVPSEKYYEDYPFETPAWVSSTVDDSPFWPEADEIDEDEAATTGAATLAKTIAGGSPSISTNVITKGDILNITMELKKFYEANPSRKPTPGKDPTNAELAEEAMEMAMAVVVAYKKMV